MGRSSKFLKIFAITYLIFLYAPALLLPIFSFNSSQIIAFPLSGFTTGWFEALLYQETLHEALRNSLIVATSSSIFATILGTLASRSNQPIPISWKTDFADIYFGTSCSSRNYSGCFPFDRTYSAWITTKPLERCSRSHIINNALFHFNNEFCF